MNSTLLNQILQSEDYKYILAIRDKIPQCSHASNIITKVENPPKKNIQRSLQALNSIIPQYAHYLRKMLTVTSFDREDICLKVKYLNDYYNFIHDNVYDNVFTAQSKFRPTILEEFLFLLFKDYVSFIKKQNHDKSNVLNSGSTKAYSNIYIKAKNLHDFIQSPAIGVNEKDQDYAIYRTFDIKINDSNPIKIRIPAVAIEAKTYIDKTMLDSIIATAEKIKSGNPHTRFVSVTERYDVSFSVDPAYSRIDQIYVLRKSVRKGEWTEINSDVVYRLFHEVQLHLERQWANIKDRIEEEGVII